MSSADFDDFAELEDVAGLTFPFAGSDAETFDSHLRRVFVVAVAEVDFLIKFSFESFLPVRCLRSIFLGLFAAGDLVEPDLVESEVKKLPPNHALHPQLPLLFYVRCFAHISKSFLRSTRPASGSGVSLAFGYLAGFPVGYASRKKPLVVFIIFTRSPRKFASSIFPAGMLLSYSLAGHWLET